MSSPLTLARTGAQRNFAAGLSAPHKLNVDTPDLLAGGDVAAPETLLGTGAAKSAGLAPQNSWPKPGAVCRIRGRWLLRDLLAEVHVGHLNIAEALIEMRGQPVETAVLLHELELPSEIRPEVRPSRCKALWPPMAASTRWDSARSALVSCAVWSRPKRWLCPEAAAL